MEAFLTRGYAWIGWIQGFRSPALDVLFAGLSLLGDEPFYLVLLPVVYWTMSRRAGLRLALLFLASAWLNAALKGLLDLPRPSPERVTVLEPLTTGGAPSGHAQNAVVVWGYLAWVWTGLWRGPTGSAARAAPSGSTEVRAHTSPPLRATLWVFVGAALLVGAIGASRVYRGVHFPVDVALGWAVGVVTLTIFLAVLRPLEDWLVRRGAATLAMLSAAALLGMLALHREAGGLAAAATFLGVATGAVWERRRLGFSSVGPVIHLGLRLGLGLAVAITIWLGLRGPLDGLGDPGRFVRYLLLGAWLSAGAPWVFVRLGIARGDLGGTRGGTRGGGARGATRARG